MRLRYPVEPWNVSSPYGMRIHPLDKARRLHAGEDVKARSGTPIYAAAAGRVTTSRRSTVAGGGYGEYIVIEHPGLLPPGSRVTTFYAHLQTKGRLVAVDDIVKAGELIGYMGSTGASTGPHLHFEVRINGVAVDPAPYLHPPTITLASLPAGRFTGAPKMDLILERNTDTGNELHYLVSDTEVMDLAGADSVEIAAYAKKWGPATVLTHTEFTYVKNAVAQHKARLYTAP